MALKINCGGRLLILLSFYSLSLCAQNFSVRGRAIDERTNLPISGVAVSPEGTSILVLSDSDGAFVLNEIPEGEHILEFTKNSFFSKRLPVLVQAELDIGNVYLEPDLVSVQQQTAIINLSDHDLDEESGGFSNISGLLQSSRDVFLNAAAFDFSSSFFRPRGYDSEYSEVMINGISMNKFFSGRPLWSNWGGLNDVQRNQEFSNGLTPSEVSFGKLAGTTNIIMRASQNSPGGKVSIAMANRSYTGRLMGSYHTGLNAKGWAFSFSAARRFAEESYVQGSTYESNSFFASVEKRLNPDHSLNFTGFFTPVKRGKSSPNTREVFDLKGNKYNSYWGYQNGEIRNSRIQRVEEPVLMLNHYWNISPGTNLNTGISYQFGRVGNSRIDYGGSRLFFNSQGEDIFIGGGTNPDPAYYQKLPSYFLRSEDRLDYRSAYLAQQDFLKNGQLNWEELYAANLNQAQNGGNSLYVLYEDINDDQLVSFNTLLRKELNARWVLNSGLNFRSLKSENFAQVESLLGGTAFLDVDSFSEGSKAQNDLLNPNRLVGEGDKFKYHYDLLAKDLGSFVQFQYFGKKWEFYTAVEGSYLIYQRNGFYQNGNFPDTSLGKSVEPDFLSYSLKGGLNYKLSGRHIFSANLGYFRKPPTLRNSFSNARQNNKVVKDLTQEKIEIADLGYVYRSPKLKGRITAFYAEFKDVTELSFYFADGLSGSGRDSTTAFVQEVMTGIEKRHIGIEFGWEFQVTTTLKVKTAGSFGEYVYNRNPSIYLTSDDFTEDREMGRASLKNYRVPGGPQHVAQIGLEYRDPEYWWIGVSGNYFSHAFLDIAPLLRTSNFLTDNDGLPINDYDLETAKRLLKQEKFDDYFLVNMVGGKSWRIKDKYLGFFASINNLLEVSYITGGYEQSRNVNYSLLKEDKERDHPLFGNKYWFGPGTTYYAHVYFRF